MRRTTWFAALAASAASWDALALGSIADVTIIDRESGTSLPTYYFQGEYWVAGTPGARYAIEIRNCTGGRVLAVTSVDGVNVISGMTAGWDQTGYVFDAGQRYQLSGWRKSNAEVAAFVFTASPNSYAERTGRPANVGIIGVALFRERLPQPVYSPPKIDWYAREATAPAAGGAGRSSVGQPADRAQASASQAMPMTVPKLGTGHGEREYSYVVDTDFRRMRAEPNELIRIRYDSLENLVAMGIVPRPPVGVPPPNPFPGSQQRQFVPDPPG